MKAFFTTLAALLWSAGAALSHTVLPGDTVPTVSQDAAFSLIDQNGRPFSEADLIGQPTAVFFGFASCPDVCPMTLANLGAMLDALGPVADDLRVVMITIDPENDTPDVMKTYLANFNPAYIGLTGSAGQTQAAAGRFYVSQSRTGDAISHSASVYLLDATGQIQDAIFNTESATSALSKLRALLGST